MIGVAELIETYRGAVYPWHCDHMGHMDSKTRKSTAFPADILARGKTMLCEYRIER